MKDGIASWLLVLWLLVTGSKPFFDLIDALHANRSGWTILWDATVAFVVAIVGTFLIRHYISVSTDLNYYKDLEDSREKDLRASNDHNA